MFNLDQDRRDYGRLLSPPVGYELEVAIGTTFSLDLEALTLATLSLSDGLNTDSMVKQDPLYLLHSLNKVSDKIVLFHEAGRIKMPSHRKNNRIYQLLEKILVPVTLPSQGMKGQFPSFHPKIWLLSFVNPKNKKDKKYRFIVLSRNLTFDRSWDVVFALEGVKYTEEQEKSLPISHFLEFLRKQTDNNHHSEFIKKISKEIRQVNFGVLDRNFVDYYFLPMGIGDNTFAIEEDKWLSKKKGGTFNQLVIMSPFLSSRIIERFCKRQSLTNTTRTLITRKQELSKLTTDTSNLDIYHLKDTIIDGEDNISDNDLEKRKQDIHAKLFLFTKGSHTWLYGGSMNASESAFHYNVEFDLCLKIRNRYMTANGFLDEVFGPDPDAPSNPFEKCDTLSINNEKENDGVDFDNVFKWICRAGGRAKIEQKSDSYDLLVAFEEQQQNNIPGGFKITIAPLCGNKEAQTLGKELRFVDLQFIDLSVLYTVTVEELGTKYRRSRIIALPTKGMPDDRDKAIVNSIVSDKVKFAQYLSYLLDSDKLMAAIRTEHYSKEFVSKGSHHFSLTGNLYEKLLKVATDEPERLRELDKLMNMLDDNTIIEEFKQLYAVFKKALKIKQ